MYLNKTCHALLAVGLVLASPLASARFAVEPHWVGGQLGVADIDVDDDDLDVVEAYTVELGRWFTNNFGLEMGAAALRDAKEEGADNRSIYKLSMETNEVFVGPRFSTNHFNTFRVFGSAGVLYSSFKIEVHEDFYDIKPAGNAGDRDEALGYYVTGGVSFALPSRVDLNAVLRYRHRPDALETYAGEIDIDDASVNVGAAFRF